ncbi:MAG: hydantoinase/oxoprolinase family protein [Pseudomonadota bacterium]
MPSGEVSLSTSSDDRLRLGVDIGGTFTDFALFGGAGTLAIHKQLTTPDDPSEAVLDGIAFMLERDGHALRDISEIVHGTTLVTNSIIERRGAVTGLVTTRGFKDVLDMREEKRYDVFDLRITFPSPVVPRPRRREVTERMRYDGQVTEPLVVAEVERAAQELVEQHGVEALAVGFLHAYANPAHEQAARVAINALYPDLPVTLSSDVFGGRREYERFTTASLNAFTQPMFARYLRRLETALAALGFGGRLYVMSSSGGTLTPSVAAALPVRVVESGPAAGVQMSAFHGRALGRGELLSFDMGGTTAKGALIRGGETLKVYELEVAREHDFKAGSGLPLRTPVVDMIEIGAGGGSVASMDARETVQVGPRSAGAQPGPACYGQGGVLATLTDANVVLGYLDPDNFLGGAMRLDPEAARTAIEEHVARPLGISVERAALGIHETISEDVARAFRIHASERGFDYRRSTMVAFGGSGPVHALSVARKLRIPRVVFPVAAGVMSALGLLASPLAFEVSRSRECYLDDLEAEQFVAEVEELLQRARAPLTAAGLTVSELAPVVRLDMRYQGQGHEIEVTMPDADALHRDFAQLARLFRERYAELYAFATLTAPLVITNWKVEITGPTPGLQAGYQLRQEALLEADGVPGNRPTCFGPGERWLPAQVVNRYSLLPGEQVVGPALIEERESTVVVGPEDRVVVDEFGNLVAELEGGSATADQD